MADHWYDADWYDDEDAGSHFMVGGAGRYGGADPRHQNAPEHLAASSAMLSSSKVPPYWAPDLEKRGYPFRIWVQDIGVWAASTELGVQVQGGAVVQRLGGVARDFCREIPLGVLRDGRQEFDATSGLQVDVTGLQFLLRGLQRRFGEEELDASIQAAVELLTFRRLDGETIDNVLGRYELVRNRSDSIAGMTLGEGVLAWLLLTHLNISKRDWPVLLAPTGGALPRDAAQYRNLQQQIRRQAHLLERTHSGPRTLEEGWRTPAFSGSRSQGGYFADGGAYTDDVWTDAPSYAAGWTDDDDYGYDFSGGSFAAGWADDGYGDTDTEPEDGQEMTEEEWSHFVGDMSDTTVESLRQEYLFARRRFRAAAERPARRFRKGKGKGRAKGGGKRSKNPFSTGRAYSVDPFGPSSLAGGKGKNKGKKGKGDGRNPIGQDGQVMRCHECGSPSHLIRECPLKKGKGKAKNSFNAAWHSSPTQLSADSFAGTPADAGHSPQFAGPMSGTTSWFVGESPQADETDGHVTLDMRSLSASIAQLSFPQPARPARAEPDRTTIWSSPLPGPARAVSHWAWWQDGENAAAMDCFHVRMAERNGEALLIDPGSPDNLMGEAWSRRQSALATRAGYPPAGYTEIDPFKVGGVGKEAQTCHRRAHHHICLEEGETGTFTGPELPNSQVPALLGLRSLDAMRCLLDVPNRKLYKVGPGGYQIRLSPGSTVYQLERGNAGHLMLPCSEFQQPVSRTKPPTHLLSASASSSS